jgi:hypothetical protein
MVTALSCGFSRSIAVIAVSASSAAETSPLRTHSARPSPSRAA